jgi:Zn-dependent protease with chaperone function
MWLGGKPTKLSRLLRALSRVVWTVCALPGWLAWVVLRFGWRIAEYDADRFVFLSGEGEALRIALERRQAQWRSGRLTWREIHDALSVRLRDGRSIGYLPIPNEHPSPRRRLDHLEHLGKAQRIWDTEIWRTARRAALGSVTPIYSEPAESSAGSAKG